MPQPFILTRIRNARRWAAASVALATALAFTAPVGAGPYYAIDGLRVRPAIGQFGGVEVDSCNWDTLGLHGQDVHPDRRGVRADPNWRNGCALSSQRCWLRSSVPGRRIVWATAAGRGRWSAILFPRSGRNV